MRGPLVVLDDSAGKTALLMRGRWRPAHMKGARDDALPVRPRLGRGQRR